MPVQPPYMCSKVFYPDTSAGDFSSRHNEEKGAHKLCMPHHEQKDATPHLPCVTCVSLTMSLKLLMLGGRRYLQADGAQGCRSIIRNSPGARGGGQETDFPKTSYNKCCLTQQAAGQVAGALAPASPAADVETASGLGVG